jgi:hypothetical protein
MTANHWSLIFFSNSRQCIKFATYERFFCCTACMSGYKKKYAG